MTGEDVLNTVLAIVTEHNQEFADNRPNTVTLTNAYRSGRLKTFEDLGIELKIVPPMWGHYLRPRPIMKAAVKFKDDDKWFYVWGEPE